MSQSSVRTATPKDSSETWENSGEKQRRLARSRGTHQRGHSCKRRPLYLHGNLFSVNLFILFIFYLFFFVNLVICKSFVPTIFSLLQKRIYLSFPSYQIKKQFFPQENYLKFYNIYLLKFVFQDMNETIPNQNDKLLIHKESWKTLLKLCYRCWLWILTSTKAKAVLRIQTYLKFTVNKCCLLKLFSLSRLLKMLNVHSHWSWWMFCLSIPWVQMK